MAFYELRQYRIQPGRGRDWVRVMEERIIPHVLAGGMTVAGSFVDEGDSDRYTWLCRFEDENERARLYEVCYGSEAWKSNLAPVVAEFLVREEIRVTRIVPTALSVLQ